MHDVCVVVVSDDDKLRPGSALASLFERAGGIELDAVLVDRGNGGSAEYVEENFVGVRTVRCAGRSLGYAKNCALETVDARYVLFLDPDLEVCEGNLSALVSLLDDQPDVALAGVRQLKSSGSPMPSMRRLWTCDWTSGFMLVRGTALEKVGWFDERFSLYAGEADLCLRLKRTGWRVAYSPCMTVRRRKGHGRWDPGVAAQAAYSRMQFSRKHFPRVAADYRWVLALRYALRVGLYSLPRLYESDRRQAARAALVTVLRGHRPSDDPSAL